MRGWLKSRIQNKGGSIFVTRYVTNLFRDHRVIKIFQGGTGVVFNVIAWVRSQVCRHSPRPAWLLNHDRIADTYVLHTYTFTCMSYMLIIIIGCLVVGMIRYRHVTMIS